MHKTFRYTLLRFLIINNVDNGSSASVVTTLVQIFHTGEQEALKKECVWRQRFKTDYRGVRCT